MVSRDGVSSWRGKQPLLMVNVQKHLKVVLKKVKDKKKDLNQECKHDNQCKTNFCKHIKYNDKYGIFIKN